MNAASYATYLPQRHCRPRHGLHGRRHVIIASSWPKAPPSAATSCIDMVQGETITWVVPIEEQNREQHPQRKVHAVCINCIQEALRKQKCQSL